MALFLLFITLTILLSFFSSESSFLVLSLSFFPFMPFPVLFPCHILASVFHVCPRVQYSVLRFRFYSLSFCHLEISHRKWPLPCQKTQHQSYTPLTWPTIHWTTKVHASKSLFFCYTSLSPPVCLFTCLCLFLHSLYQHVHLLFLSLSGCFFCCSFLSLLC